jgi:hypothetical protein
MATPFTALAGGASDITGDVRALKGTGAFKVNPYLSPR